MYFNKHLYQGHTFYDIFHKFSVFFHAVALFCIYFFIDKIQILWYNIIRGDNMITVTSGHFLSYSNWFESVIKEDVILRCTSALEILGMFDGLIDEKNIDVYALKQGIYDNINYHIVDTFENIEIQKIRNIRFTSFSQTVNDMLSDLYNADECALTEALANYYCMRGDSFDGLYIKKENISAFEKIKDSAIEYYSEG